MMGLILQYLHIAAGIVVLAEALNKLERTSPLAKGLTLTKRIEEILKALAWLGLALGAGGAIAAPLLLRMGIHSVPSMLLRLETPTLAETAVLFGFAVLVIRTRIKEG